MRQRHLDDKKNIDQCQFKVISDKSNILTLSSMSTSSIASFVVELGNGGFDQIRIIRTLMAFFGEISVTDGTMSAIGRIWTNREFFCKVGMG